MDHRAKTLPIPLLSHVALGKVNPGGHHTSSYLPHIEATQWAKKPNLWTFVDISVTVLSMTMKLSGIPPYGPPS